LFSPSAAAPHEFAATSGPERPAPYFKVNRISGKYPERSIFDDASPRIRIGWLRRIEKVLPE